MGIPSDPLLDIIRRSIINLEFIEANYETRALYEVTQLVNTFLGALIHPFERSSKGKQFIAYFTHKPVPINVFYKIEVKEDFSYYDFLKCIRHALAHGNIRYNPDNFKRIQSVDFWNKEDNKKTFRCTISLNDMKHLLLDFKNCIEKIYK
ncbi:hypothetical protein HNW77_06860 [Komagataeibacter sp. AV436]|uniref:pEK499-p136 HEPN domain-containing protein n=1 Tax=Komagataeibacter melomenusus TaxID=2766578 RepID=A0ABX2AE38_9PROT|nr:HEPN family nuclease [Komagataeibacter melomenusus]MBV1830376.1 hypothetical protein [Komagataeibacter melomenusus]NPC66114.1 hypothetical protein [Komagataeibacter melomenusus]